MVERRSSQTRSPGSSQAGSQAPWDSGPAEEGSKAEACQWEAQLPDGACNNRSKRVSLFVVSHLKRGHPSVETQFRQRQRWQFTVALLHPAPSTKGPAKSGPGSTFQAALWAHEASMQALRRRETAFAASTSACARLAGKVPRRQPPKKPAAARATTSTQPTRTPEGSLGGLSTITEISCSFGGHGLRCQPLHERHERRDSFSSADGPREAHRLGGC